MLTKIQQTFSQISSLQESKGNLQGPKVDKAESAIIYPSGGFDSPQVFRGQDEGLQPLQAGDLHTCMESLKNLKLIFQ